MAFEGSLGLDELRGRWFHSIDLGGGIVTQGKKSAGQLAAELAALQLPDLAGKSVLDIGAWDGYFSFAAERLGAARVVAVDHYVWSIDWLAAGRYEDACRARGIPCRPWDEVPDAWRPDTLPGRACFEAAHAHLSSKVEVVAADFMTLDPDTVGTFDVVLFLGVLYHVKDPFAALRQVAALSRDLTVIETEVLAATGYDRYPLWEFHETDELRGDATNWWTPNAAGLRAACRAAGYRRVEINPQRVRTRVKRAVRSGTLVHGRATARAWKS